MRIRVVQRAAPLALVFILGFPGFAKPATHLVITGSTSQTAGGPGNSLTITAADNQGRTDPNYFGPQPLTFSGASSSLNPVIAPTVTDMFGTPQPFGTTTTINFVAGVATVTAGSANGLMVLYRAEIATISVTDGTLSSNGNDRLTVTVSPSTLSSFSFALTSPQTNGVAFAGTNTLTALDAFGNVETTFDPTGNNVIVTTTLTGSITGLGSGGNNVLNRTSDFASGVANLTSVLTFTGTVGTGTFTAASISGSSGTSGSVTIQPGPLSTFLIEQAGGGSIPTQTAGNAFNIRITAQDASGNTETGFTGTVVLTSVNGGLEGAPLTSGAFSNGVLSTQTVALTTAGNGRTITATNSSGPQSGTSNGFTVNPGAVSAATSSISANPTSIVANGASTSAITVQAKDAFGNNLTTGGATVMLSTTLGSVSPLQATDHGDGTYGTTLTSSTKTGTATISGAVNGGTMTSTATVAFTPGPLGRFLIEQAGGGSIPTQTAGTAFNIQVTAQDSSGNTETGFTGTVVLTSANGGLLGAPLTSGAFVNGVLSPQSVTLTSAGPNRTITATNSSGPQSGTSSGFTVNPGAPSAATSTIGANPASIVADGSSKSAITVQAKDAFGNNLTSGGAAVTLSATQGTLSGVADHGDGTYGATLTSATTSGTATVSGTLNTVPIVNTATVIFTPGPLSTFLIEKAGGGPVPAETLNVPFNIRITAQDASGNTVTGFAGTVTLTSTPAGLEGAPVTSGSFTNGVLPSQSVTMTAVGNSFTLKATHTGGPEKGTSNSFPVLYPPPTLTLVQPPGALRGQTLNILLTGSNYIQGVTSVSFGNNITVNSTTVNSPTQITVNIRIGGGAVLGPRNIYVINPSPGGGSASGTFTVGSNPIPGITAVSPTGGTRLQTLTVVVTGSEFFAGVTSANFGTGVTTNSVTVDSATGLRANITIGSGAPTGPHDVSVINAPPGGGTATLSGAFAVTNPVPVLAGITPSSGSRQQTLQVAMQGTNFIAGVTTVDMGSGIAVDTVVVDSATGLRATVRIDSSAAIGPRGASVVNAPPGGGSSGTVTFTVNSAPPAITTTSPSNATAGGPGFTLTVFGTNFTSTSVVAFDSVNKPTTYVATTELRATIAAADIQRGGVFPVNVFTPSPGGGYSNTLSFTVNNPVPSLTAIAPATAVRLQTLSVVLTGTNFIAGVSTVSFGDSVGVNSVTVNSSTQITAGITVAGGAALGTRPVAVFNGPPGGGTATLPNALSIGNPVPVVSSVVPSSGGRLDTLRAVIAGSNFLHGVTSVAFGGPGITVDSAVVLDAAHVAAYIRIDLSAPTGARAVTVSNTAPGGGSDTLAGAFSVVNPVPVLSSIAPTNADKGTAVTLTLTGAKFISGVTTVTFIPNNNITIQSTTINSSTQVTLSVAIDASAADGPRSVVAVNASPGGGVSSSVAFTIGSNPAPGLASVNPTNGVRLQTLTVVMRGSGFFPGLTTASFDTGVTTNSVTVDSATGLRANITIGAGAPTGAHTVSVTNAPPGGGTATLTGAFTVTNPVPGLAGISPSSGDRQQTLQVAMQGTNFIAGVTTLDMGSGITVDTVVVDSATGLHATVTIDSSAAIGPRGVSVVNVPPGGGRSGTVTFTVMRPTYPSTYALSNTVNFPLYSSPSGYSTSDYRIIGLPGDGKLPVDSLFGGTQATDWQVYWDNGAPSNYLIANDGTQTFLFSAGRAFWVINRGPWTVHATVPTASLDTNQVASLQLHTGWNLITNPFNAVIQWQQVQTANGGLTDPIFSFNGSFDTATVFAPYAGYYYFNSQNLSVLRVPFAGTLSGAGRRVAGGNGWRIGVGLASRGFHEAVMQLGVSADATPGINRYTFRKPRAVGALPSAYFPRPEWDPVYSSFATDIRPPYDSIQTWRFVVASPAHQILRLTFSGLNNVPHDFRVVLVNETGGVISDLRPDSVCTYLPPMDTTTFSLLAGRDDLVKNELGRLMPKTFALRSNFPNPFNPTTTIPVDVPIVSEISLKVYDITGAEVKTLASGPLAPGRYWFQWDGRNTNGSPAATGVYFVSLTTGSGIRMTGKMLLLR